MNPYDVVLLVLMALLALMGAIWGLTRIAAGLLGFFVAFFLGLRFSGMGPVWFGRWIESQAWARLVGFFVVFFAVMIVAALGAYLLRRFLKAVLLGWADRAAGAAGGVVAALLAGAALAMPLTALPPADDSLLEDSVLAPYALGVADVVRHLVPEDLARQYRDKSKRLRDAWSENSEDRENRGS